MAKNQHPWQIGATELIEFALDNMQKGGDFDRRLSYLILDVGVETLLKTYLTLPESVTQFQIKRSDRYIAVDGNFHDLLRGVQSANPKKASSINFSHIEHYHNLRNTLYHQGNQVATVPMNQLDGYARLAVNLLKIYLEVDLSKKLKSSATSTRKASTNRERMLSKCTRDASQFFGYILDLSESQGHEVYWGTTGFSIRVHLPNSENLASIAYGYPTDLFQLYFAQLPFSKERVSSLRAEFTAMGIFKQSPKTLTAQLKPDNIQHAKAAYKLMEHRVTEWLKG